MSRLPGIGSHQSARVTTDEWLTPPYITKALGHFDLDPATTIDNWTRAERWYCLDRDDDGLSLPWEGRVWLNPPYSEVGQWMAKMAEHNHGTALVFARTETVWWHVSVWSHAAAIMFLRGRLTFHFADGSTPKANSGAPSALIAYGPADALALHNSKLPGAIVAFSERAEGLT